MAETSALDGALEAPAPTTGSPRIVPSEERMGMIGKEGCEASHGGTVSKPKGGSTSEAALSG